MSKSFFLFIFFLFCVVTAISSQTFYLRTGVAYSELDWMLSEPGGYREVRFMKPVIGYAVGLGLEYIDKGLFSLSSEVSFYRNGGKYTEEEEIRLREYSEIIIDYASFGTYININPINGTTKLQLQIGPRVDILLGDKDQNELFFLNQNDALAETNYGFNMGLGLYQDLGKMHIGVQGVWLQRLKKLIDLGISDSNLGVGIKAEEAIFLFQLSIGYKLK